MTLAVAGGISITSAHCPSSMCHVPASIEPDDSSENVPTTTFSPESVERASGATNCFAASVITMRTAAPDFLNSRTTNGILYAAIPPVTPTRMCFFLDMGGKEPSRSDRRQRRRLFLLVTVCELVVHQLLDCNLGRFRPQTNPDQILVAQEVAQRPKQ